MVSDVSDVVVGSAGGDVRDVLVIGSSCGWIGMAEAVARASKAALRAVVWENWGVRVPGTAMWLSDGHARQEKTHLTPWSAFPVADFGSLRSFVSGAHKSKDSQNAGGSLVEVGPSSSESATRSWFDVEAGAGWQGRGAVGRVARQYVYTLHPSSRRSIRPTSLNTLPHVRIPGSPKYVFYFKEGIYQLLLVGPNSVLLPRSLIRMEFAHDADAQSKPLMEKDRVGLHYIHHEHEFLVGVRGSREDVERIKSRIVHFLRNELHLEVGLSSDVHTQSGSVVFLGTRIAGLVDHKTRRRFSKEVEKRRKSKIRAQQMAKVRTETWHNELRDLALQSWGFGLKRTKQELQSWEFAKQAMYKQAQSLGSTFVLDQMERGMSQDAIHRLLEEDVFFDAPSTGVPEAVLRAHHRLTRLMEKHLEDETAFEKKAKAVERRQPRIRIGQDDGVIPLQLLAPMEIITEKLRMKGILQPGKALPTVLTSMINSSDEAIVSYFAALATCLLSYYRCCDNFQKVRRLVDYQVRWAALLTLARKHECSAKQIISQFSRGPRILNRKGGVIVEFPSSPAIAHMAKTFLPNVQQSTLDDVLRSGRLQLLPSETKHGPRRVRLQES